MSIPILCTQCSAPIHPSDKEVCPKCGLKQSTLVITPREPGYIRIGGARGREWEKATGIVIFPVLHVVAELANVFGEDVLCFRVDFSRLDRAHAERIVDYLALKFTRPRPAVVEEIKSAGLTIMAENCEVLRAR